MTDGWRRLDAAALRAWPLPGIDEAADKEDRGSVLVIAGSREVPGAAALAAMAALRAGAGKLQVATAASAAASLAIALPEARVIALPETPEGGFDESGLRLLESPAKRAAAVLVGSGCMDEAAMVRFTRALLPQLAHCPVVLDALAMSVLRGGAALGQPAIVSPHAGEMAHLTGLAKDVLEGNPDAAAEAASRWNVTVALKGATTLLASPSGGRWRHEGGHPGLATSGSGDVLAGLIVGLAARGASAEQAGAWGIVLHAQAGGRLARRIGPIGFLARELPAEIPALLRSFSPAAAGETRSG